MADPYAQYGGSMDQPPVDPYAKYGGQAEAETDAQKTPSLLSRLANQPSQFSHLNPLRYFDELGQGMAQGAEALAHPIDTAKQMYQSFTDKSPTPELPVGELADMLFKGYGQEATGASAAKVLRLPAQIRDTVSDSQRASAQATELLRQSLARKAGNARLDLNPQYPGAPNPQATPELLQARQLAVGAKPAPPDQSAALASIKQATPELLQARQLAVGAKPAPPDQSAALASIKQATPELETAGESVPVGKFTKEVPNPDPYKFSGAPKSMDIVQSTNVGKVGYNPDAKVMTVEYKNGFVYSYHGVPQEIFNAAKESESVGSYISRNVKGRYETVRRGSVLVKKK